MICSGYEDVDFLNYGFVVPFPGHYDDARHVSVVKIDCTDVGSIDDADPNSRQPQQARANVATPETRCEEDSFH